MWHFIFQRVIIYRILLAFTGCMFSFAPAQAGLIRDAQIEEYLHQLTTPIAGVAGINPDNLRIFIVADSRINAFVADGSNIFVNTGLITNARNPDMIMGVLAHEMGHIYAGHIVGISQNVEQAQAQMIMSYLLGAAAAAAGSPDVGAAIMSGGGHIANRSLLAHSRANEQAADQAAIGFLDKLQLSSIGMLQMFERLRREEKKYLMGQNIDSYARTHPLSKERITHMRAHVEATKGKYPRLDQKLQTEHQQVKAKLIGYLEDPTQVMVEFGSSNNTSEAHIARAIAKMRISLFNEALQEAEALIALEPNNPYFHEIKGAVLYEARRYDEAIIEYQIARKLLPNSALIRSDYAKVMVASGREDLQAEAKQELLYASEIDPTYQPTWRNLAKIYGREGEIGKAELCLAEIDALNQNKEDLIAHLDRAEQRLNDNDAGSRLRLQDLRLYAETLEDTLNPPR
jgi:predicted Zn-dependent protease